MSYTAHCGGDCACKLQNYSETDKTQPYFLGKMLIDNQHLALLSTMTTFVFDKE